MAPGDFRDRLLKGLGGAWPEPSPLKPKHLETIKKDGFRIEKLTYEAEADDVIPAMLLVPDGVTADKPAPAVCVWHQHGTQT